MEKVKKKKNIVLYTILMTILFVIIAEGIIWGYGGNLIVTSIFHYPQGSLVVSEAVLAALILIVMLLFKNGYVFTQKRESLKTGLFYGLFYLIFSVLFTILNGIDGAFNNGYTVVNLLIGCFLVGVAEEFLCRGWLLNEFLERFGDTKKGVWQSIIISGIIFGLMHLSNIGGQDVASTITQVMSAACTGIVYGLIYYKTKNIWSVIILHGFWDFSLFLSMAVPSTKTIVSTTSLSIIGIVFTILLVLAELMNIIPYIKDIDAKPKKKTVIIIAVVSCILYFIFLITEVNVDTTLGDTYKFGNISLEHYAVTHDNYEKYNINHTITTTSQETNELGEVVEYEVNNNYSFKLTKNNDNNLVLTNTITNDNVIFECEDLGDYTIIDNNDSYILAYLDYTDMSNEFMNYVYIKKDELSNNKEYLNTIKNNMKKYLVPTYNMELLTVNDYDNNKSYLSAYHMDYGYFLLVNENEMSVLNRD